MQPQHMNQSHINYTKKNEIYINISQPCQSINPVFLPLSLTKNYADTNLIQQMLMTTLKLHCYLKIDLQLVVTPRWYMTMPLQKSLLVTFYSRKLNYLSNSPHLHNH